MANRVYLVEISKTNSTMDSLASNMEKAKCYKVDSADVTAFEAELPANSRFYMSCDEDDVQSANGFQEDGVTLPEKVVQG